MADQPVPTSDEKKSSQRLLSLDALRGIAVFLMIEQHLGVWLWEGTDPGKTVFDYPGLLTFNALGGGAAPLFITLAGIGSALMAHACEKRGDNPDRKMVLRGLAVMGFGYLLSLLVPSWFTWRTWFVLHLMGFGMVLGPIWRRVPTWALLALTVAVLVATPFVQRGLGTPDRLWNYQMAGFLDEDMTRVKPWAPLRIAVAEGQFPIFPWLAFFLFGNASGRFIVEARIRPVAILSGVCLAIGAAFAAGYYLFELPWMLSNWRAFRVPIPFFPTTPTFVLLLMGIVGLAVSVALAIERRRPLSERGVVVTLGRASLTLLILHVVMFREWTRPIDVWQNLTPSEVFAVTFAFVGIAAVAARAWQRVGYKWGAEWLLRQIA